MLIIAIMGYNFFHEITEISEIYTKKNDPIQKKRYIERKKTQRRDIKMLLLIYIPGLYQNQYFEGAGVEGAKADEEYKSGPPELSSISVYLYLHLRVKVSYQASFQVISFFNLFPDVDPTNKFLYSLPVVCRLKYIVEVPKNKIPDSNTSRVVVRYFRLSSLCEMIK